MEDAKSNHRREPKGVGPILFSRHDLIHWVIVLALYLIGQWAVLAYGDDEQLRSVTRVSVDLAICHLIVYAVAAFHMMMARRVPDWRAYYGRGYEETRHAQHLTLASILSVAWLRAMHRAIPSIDAAGLWLPGVRAALYGAAGFGAVWIYLRFRRIRVEETGLPVPGLREAIEPKWEIVHWGVTIAVLVISVVLIAVGHTIVEPTVMIAIPIVMVVINVAFLLICPVYYHPTRPVANFCYQIPRLLFVLAALYPWSLMAWTSLFAVG